MKNRILVGSIIILSSFILITGCDKDDVKCTEESSEPVLRIRIDVDPNQERLDNLGNPEDIPDGHAAQNPNFNQVSAHYLELAPTDFTALGDGEIIYNAPETKLGGESAIDFSQSLIIEPGDEFIEIPISQLANGTYKWVRMSLSYQNYDVNFNFDDQEYTGTLASFVGFNTYITDYIINSSTVSINENKLQGYWGFETLASIIEGQSPEGGTTVPNPNPFSPIPAGSCVVTGEFSPLLNISGNEDQDIELILSLSTNQSFEWIDGNNNGLWDVGNGSNESVVDMGLRGLIPIIGN